MGEGAVEGSVDLAFLLHWAVTGLASGFFLHFPRLHPACGGDPGPRVGGSATGLVELWPPWLCSARRYRGNLGKAESRHPAVGLSSGKDKPPGERAGTLSAS